MEEGAAKSSASSSTDGVVADDSGDGDSGDSGGGDSASNPTVRLDGASNDSVVSSTAPSPSCGSGGGMGLHGGCSIAGPRAKNLGRAGDLDSPMDDVAWIDDSDSEDENASSLLCMCQFVDAQGRSQHMCEQMDENCNSACAACLCCRCAAVQAALCGAASNAEAARAEECLDRVRVPCPGGARRVDVGFTSAFFAVAALHGALSPLHPVAGAAGLLLAPLAWIAVARSARHCCPLRFRRAPARGGGGASSARESLFLRGWVVASYLVAAAIFGWRVYPALLDGGGRWRPLGRRWGGAALGHVELALFISVAATFYRVCTTDPGDLGGGRSSSGGGSSSDRIAGFDHKCAFIGGRWGGAVGAGNESHFLSFLSCAIALCAVFAHTTLSSLSEPSNVEQAHAYYFFLCSTSVVPVLVATLVRRSRRAAGVARRSASP